MVLAVALALTACDQPVPVPTQERAAQLWDTCAACHGDNGEGNRSYHAPAIAGLPEWFIAEQLHKFKAGIRADHPDDVTGLRMRPMARTLLYEGEVESVAKLVAAMPATHPAPTSHEPDLDAGKASYMLCVACHGPDGRGNDALKAPTLVGQNDWYLVHQLEKFKSKIRGTNAKDVTGAQMLGMAATLKDHQAMVDVIAYAQSLGGDGAAARAESPDH
jgi:cytochrome c553